MGGGKQKPSIGSITAMALASKEPVLLELPLVGDLAILSKEAACPYSLPVDALRRKRYRKSKYFKDCLIII